MEALIQNATAADVTAIETLYSAARAYQQTQGAVVWPLFGPDFIQADIAAKTLWKLIANDHIVCVWSTTFSDPEIWEARNADPAVYIHRIATHPEQRGRHFMQQIVAWAKGYAKAHGKQFIRMDTVGNNEKLIAYYESCGFHFLGMHRLQNTASLPAHYQKDAVCFFEMKVE